MKRKTSSAPAPTNRLLLATLLLLAFAGSIGLATVWVRHQISEVAQSSKQFEARTREVERRTAEVTAQIAAALDPKVLLRQNASLRLGLGAPREHQIVRIETDVELALAAKRNSAGITLANFVPESFRTTTPR